MDKASFQPNVHDPRWGEIRASLPMVERWFALVVELLRLGGSGEQGRSLGGSDAFRSLAEVLRDVAPDASEALDDDSPVFRNPEGVPIEMLPIDVDERIRLRSVFEQYEECQDIFTPAQWPAVCLRYRDALPEEQVAVCLGKGRSTVHGLLKRARLRKEKYQRQRRKETFVIARKYLK